MQTVDEASFLILLKNQNENTIGIIYDTYAAAIYGCICNDISDKQAAAEILADIFIRFNREVANRDYLNEGLFICLYRIYKKIMLEYVK